MIHFYDLHALIVQDKQLKRQYLPAVGKQAGDELEFGGLLGSGPIMKINQSDNSVMIHRMGRIPAPLQSLKN